MGVAPEGGRMNGIPRGAAIHPPPDLPPVQGGGVRAGAARPLLLPLPCRGRVGVGVAGYSQPSTHLAPKLPKAPEYLKSGRPG